MVPSSGEAKQSSGFRSQTRSRSASRLQPLTLFQGLSPFQCVGEFFVGPLCLVHQKLILFFYSKACRPLSPQYLDTMQYSAMAAFEEASVAFQGFTIHGERFYLVILWRNQVSWSKFLKNQTSPTLIKTKIKQFPIAHWQVQICFEGVLMVF